MLVRDILAENETSISFEFFPPKKDQCWVPDIERLLPLHPAYVSVTYGAGGSTRAHTHELVTRIQRDTELTVVAHLTCVGSDRDEIRAILERYRQAGVYNVLALRGDMPEHVDGPAVPEGGFPYAAELVEFIRRDFPQFCTGVAGFPEGHPATPNRLKEIEYLKAKVDAGADYIVTQMFFDNRDFYDYCERCSMAGIDVPIIAGIMPITSRRNMVRMADLSGGTRIPAALLRSIERAEGPEGVRNAGIHWATEQVRDLLDHNVAGVHLYTLNKADASIEICQSLGLENYGQLSG